MAKSENSKDKYEAMSQAEFKKLLHGHEKLLEAIGKL
jgi:hypothetical protein